MLAAVLVNREFLALIKTFRHKGLNALYLTGSAKGVRADHVSRLRRVLSTLTSQRYRMTWTNQACACTTQERVGRILVGQRLGQLASNF
jgi:hypothetical protein